MDTPVCLCNGYSTTPPRGRRGVFPNETGDSRCVVSKETDAAPGGDRQLLARSRRWRPGPAKSEQSSWEISDRFGRKTNAWPGGQLVGWISGAAQPFRILSY